VLVGLLFEICIVDASIFVACSTPVVFGWGLDVVAIGAAPSFLEGVVLFVPPAS
jgi:hypothetical protein